MEKKLNCIDGLTLKNEISDVSNTHLMNANFNNINDVIRITELYGDSESSFFGENQNGERIMVSVFRDRVVVNTEQSNGFVRVNTYWIDGTIEENFDGKWK